jgi:pSer/pThr/pTyr-binding forkhead associated (FHA) protein
MFTLPAASPPTLATTTSSASPASPRSGRLRGLSYLRSYTHNHILSRDSGGNSNNNNNNSSSSSTGQRQSTLARATSYPSTSDSGPASNNSSRSPTRPISGIQRPTPEPLNQSRTQESSGSTNGWLPTVGGHSGASRIGTQPQSTVAGSSSALLAGSSASSVPLDSSLAQNMGRTRSATIDGALPTGPAESAPPSTATPGAPSQTMSQLPSIRFTAYQDLRAARPSLVFSPMSRTLPTGKETIRIGRYSERDVQPVQSANVPSAAAVGFKSKVVSRRHCEFWCQNGRWFIKDVKSSSGTFLNHIRLSSPGTESRPFPVNDGDIVQLGIDFKGGEEMIFRCVKIRIELNRGWQSGLNSFKWVNVFKYLTYFTNTYQCQSPQASKGDEQEQ